MWGNSIHPLVQGRRIKNALRCMWLLHQSSIFPPHLLSVFPLFMIITCTNLIPALVRQCPAPTSHTQIILLPEAWLLQPPPPLLLTGHHWLWMLPLVYLHQRNTWLIHSSSKSQYAGHDWKGSPYLGVGRIVASFVVDFKSPGTHSRRKNFSEELYSALGSRWKIPTNQAQIFTMTSI